MGLGGFEASEYGILRVLKVISAQQKVVKSCEISPLFFTGTFTAFHFVLRFFFWSFFSSLLIASIGTCEGYMLCFELPELMRKTIAQKP